MRKIINIAVTFCLLIAIYSGAKGQGANISVDSIHGFPAQALYNEPYTFTVVLHNHDSSVYQGNVQIMFHTDIDSSNVTIDTMSGPFTISIPANGFNSFTISNFHFEPNSFKIGGNVVVVWPVSGGTPIMVTDSFTTSAEIIGYAGIPDAGSNIFSGNIYPVPAQNEIFLPKNYAESSVEYVRIIDILGRSRLCMYHYPKSVFVAELENGFYFLEVKEKNNKIRVYKFLVSR